jgi:hypothetical protein
VEELIIKKMQNMINMIREDLGLEHLSREFEQFYRNELILKKMTANNGDLL